MSTKNLATIAAVLGRAALHRRRSQVVFGNRRGNVIIGPAGVIDGNTVVVVICTQLKDADAAERGGVVFSGHPFGAISHVIGPAFHLGMACPASG